MADPDFIYDPQDWEYTWPYRDKGLVHEDMYLDPGEVKRFATLVKGPDRFLVRVVKTRDEAGDPDEIEWQWFDEYAAALAAASLSQPQNQA